MKEVAQGITILKRYGDYMTACWVLHNNGEAAIVEMPPYKQKEKPPHEKASTFFRKNKLFPKYAFISHPHWDHCHSLPQFKNRFPQTTFVGHASFLYDSYVRFLSRNVIRRMGSSYRQGESVLFDEIFDTDFWMGNIGGEPIYLIYAPKHSYGDLLIIFKGAMITGDWYIGDIKDCNDIVSPGDKVKSIDRVKATVSGMGYQIHMLFSAHGDCLFYDADFNSVMEQSKHDHNGMQPNIKAVYVPGGRSRQVRV